MLAKPNIARAVRLAEEKRAESVGETAEGVLRDLRTVTDRCMQAVEVRDKDGNGTGEWQFVPFAALKGLELIGKHRGMFVERLGNADGSNLAGVVVYLPRGADTESASEEGSG